MFNKAVLKYSKINQALSELKRNENCVKTHQKELHHVVLASGVTFISELVDVCYRSLWYITADRPDYRKYLSPEILYIPYK